MPGTTEESRATAAVALVRGVYDAFARGDVASVLDALAEDVAWRTPPTLPWSAGTYSGRDGVARYLGSFAEALVDASVAPEAVVATEDGAVAVGYERGRARATGEPFEARFVHVWKVRADGRVASMEGVADTAAVVAAFAG